MIYFMPSPDRTPAGKLVPLLKDERFPWKDLFHRKAATALDVASPTPAFVEGPAWTELI